MQTKLEIILPAHNEEGNIRPIYDAILQVLRATNYRYTILFVDDGSTDDTLSRIKELANEDSKVKYIELSRNFGHQNAIKAGLDSTNADVVVMMDCDLQHPPSLLNELLNKYEQGYDIVRTVRIENETDKENWQDFVLWKKVNDKYGYESPWSYGRPGWHLECSGMS